MNVKLFLAVATATLISAAIAHAGTVVVPGDADIFASGLSAPPSSASGGGSLPPFYAVSAGQTLDITATGSVDCCDTASTGSTGPNGFASNPFGGGSSISNSTGSSVSGFSTTGAFPLVATFANSFGTVGDVFKVGSSDLGVKVPTGATQLYFGLPDASGFNGPSGYYSDNNGSFSVAVSAVPEPATWAFMILGLGGIGLAFRQAKRNRGLRFKDCLAT
jgi:hypothetical protein